MMNPDNILDLMAETRLDLQEHEQEARAALASGEACIRQLQAELAAARAVIAEIAAMSHESRITAHWARNRCHAYLAAQPPAKGAQ